MVCPYHALASAAGLVLPTKPHGATNPHHSKSHAHHPALLTTTPTNASDKLPLSALLRESTAATHKAVERSPGVRALVGSSDQASSTLRRQDYVRWLIMLAAIYGTLEQIVVQLRKDSIGSRHAPTGLTSLFADPVLISTLARLQPLLDDINAHAAQMTIESGISIDDLGEEQALWADDDLPSSSSSSSSLLRSELKQAISSLHLSPSLVDALTPHQVEAALAYIRRLQSFVPSRDAVEPVLHPARLLAHVYVRYMGDLSGGQHIAKRAHARWPMADSEGQATDPVIIAGSPGFKSYAFGQDQWGAMPSGSGSMEEGGLELSKRKLAVEVKIKDGVRHVLDAALDEPDTSCDALAAVICDEANISFELSAALFDVLLDGSLPPHLLNSVETANKTADSILFRNGPLDEDSSAPISSTSSESDSSSDSMPSTPGETNERDASALAHGPSGVSPTLTVFAMLKRGIAMTTPWRS
ncbi:hypothetical protein OC845_003497 [Tilletia horrida]|nr:hypothetical protein OC845_003497 [Tilletia horrida]